MCDTINRSFPYSNCCDEEYDYAQSVALSLNMDWDAIESCTNNASSNSAGVLGLIQEAKMTQNLNPALETVPYVRVNGNHTQTMNSACEGDILQCVCDVYDGPPAIACGQVSSIE